MATRFLLTLLALIAVGPAAAAPARPNVVFILADDLGWADTTLYGHTRFYQTPNLERLAARGMLFTRAYAASPLCSPTRSAILTGLSPARTGITTPGCHVEQVILTATIGKAAPPGQKAIQPVPPTRLKTEYRTLAETLKEAGYATGHFGKWHLGREPYSPLEQGFDVDVPHWPGPGPAGSFVAPWKFPDFDPDTPDEHIEDRMAREVSTFMETHRGGPFFLNYWMFSVHAPFDAKRALIEKHRARVDPADPQRSPTYAAMIESMDDAVGTLLDTLDRLEIADNTVVIFTSDNGGNMYNEIDGTTPTSNAPLRGGKATLYEGGTRVPCVVAWPGLVAVGSRSDAVIQSEDFYPTLLDALAIAPADGQRFDGVSLVPALKGGALDREAVFQYFPHSPGVPDWLPPAVSVHRGDWKLIRLFHQGENGAHRHLLYHLEEDLGETRDLAAAEPDRVRTLDALIDGFLADTGAVLPIPNPAFDPAQYRPDLEGKPVPKARAKAKAADPSADPKLQGWKARGCGAAVTGGIVTVTPQSADPFLGVAAGLSGPGVIRFRLRGQSVGEGKVEWIPAGAKPEAVAYQAAPGGAWQEIEVAIPARGPLGILRVYLLGGKTPVEIDWIRWRGEVGEKNWEF
jgi:arylsulfatase A-like enzyme